ncbi:MAG: type I glyceraldehyde-3-phosphate dehydrogenase [Parachlamydiaceae bacterium]
MTIKIAINGFGRIGRLVFRILHNIPNVDVVAINDIVPPDNLAYLLKYDSTHGRFKGKVESKEDAIYVDGKRTLTFSERDPLKLPWKGLGVDYVIESTGLFTSKEDAEKHIQAGAKRVLISAPEKGDVPTFVMVVNENEYTPKKDFVVSNASCTTNCLAPMAKVLNDNFGIRTGFMVTVHAYTNDQRILDLPHSDLRRARAAAVDRAFDGLDFIR